MKRCIIARLLLVALSAPGLSGRASAATAPTEKSGDVVSEDFTVAGGAGKLTVRIQSPPAGRLAAEPLLLLNFSADRESSLQGGRYGEPARTFLSGGHRVASFDLPAHGERLDRHGKNLEGLCARMLAGEDPFALFVADGRAVIAECIRRGWAASGRIVVCGVSRAGYCALRLAASEPAIAAVAALAPVTDWREVREFAGGRERPEVAALALEHFVEPLVGRRVYVAIGNGDTRVGTLTCTRFVLALLNAESRRALPQSNLRYVIADESAGHALGNRWRQEGVQFLLRYPGPPASSSLP